jgi:hypothetical protein
MRPEKQVHLARSTKSGEPGRGSDGHASLEAPAKDTAQNTIQRKGYRHIEQVEVRGYDSAVLCSDRKSVEYDCTWLEVSPRLTKGPKRESAFRAKNG